MSRMAAQEARWARRALGSNLTDVSELALNELTGIADRACGCFELRDASSGSWVRFKECEGHGRAAPLSRSRHPLGTRIPVE